ncbi:MAG: GTP 3',8-cyclase MoaA [Phascolarctobacterium sp.]
MLDKYNRNINYMRISLTDRCNLRCVYCRPDITQMVAHSEILRYEEILRVVRCAVELGITRFKITGGEPLVRKGAVDFITKLKQIHGVEQVTLTTNGMLLEKNLPQLLACKIDGINISLDTLDKETYKHITGCGDAEAVINSIKMAVQLGLKCKLNCVPIKNSFTNKSANVDDASLSGKAGMVDSLSLSGNAGMVDNSSPLHSNMNVADLSLKTTQKNVLALVEFAGSLNVPLRFIELMPLACNNQLTSYSGSELRQILQNAGYILGPMHEKIGNGPAIYYKATKNGQSQVIGFIEPLHGKFCGSCNRVRITSTGQLKPCLYSQSTLDLRQLLRSGAYFKETREPSDYTSESKDKSKSPQLWQVEESLIAHEKDEIVKALKQAIYEKPMGHHFEEKPATFNMNEIGG